MIKFVSDATGRLFSAGHPGSSTIKTDRHDITEILLEVAVITIKQTNIVTLVLTCSSNLRHNLSVNIPNDQVNTVELVLHVTVGHWSNCVAQ